MPEKLASLQRVEFLRPIEGAENTECVRVLGWDCLVKKGMFKPGDVGVLYQFDAIVDKTNPELSFMEARGYRVKSQKFFRGTFNSLSLFMPVSMLSHYGNLVKDSEGKFVGLEVPASEGVEAYTISFLSEESDGLDITSLTKTEKYSYVERVAGAKTNLGFFETRGGFPPYLRKTDETHGQSYRWPKLKEALAGVPLYGAVKFDGSSVTFAFDGNEGPDGFHVLSRNYDLKPWYPGQTKISKFVNELGENVEEEREVPHSVYWVAAYKYNIENVLRSYAPRRLAIQAENISPSIQSGRTGVKEVEIRVFNVWDIDKQKFFSFDELKEFCEKNFLPMVDVVYENFTLDHFDDINDMIQLSRGVYPLSGFPREGLVWRPMKEMEHPLFQDNGFRASFKLINPDFEDTIKGKKPAAS